MKRLFLVSILLLGLGISNVSYTNQSIQPTARAEKDGWVMYNTSNGKYHNPNCRWAKKCTVNCIRIKYSEAVKKGGIPCKVCHGTPG